MYLSVRVERAEGLPGMDRNGLADPYVVLSLSPSTKTVKTSSKPKTLSPSWGETFQFPLLNHETQKLVFLLRDKDIFVDEDISKLELPLSEMPWHLLRGGQIVQRDYQLTPVKGKTGGKISLSLQLQRPGDQPFSSAHYAIPTGGPYFFTFKLTSVSDFRASRRDPAPWVLLEHDRKELARIEPGKPLVFEDRFPVDHINDWPLTIALFDRGGNPAEIARVEFQVVLFPINQDVDCQLDLIPSGVIKFTGRLEEPNAREEGERIVFSTGGGEVFSFGNGDPESSDSDDGDRVVFKASSHAKGSAGGDGVGIDFDANISISFEGSAAEMALMQVGFGPLNSFEEAGYTVKAQVSPEVLQYFIAGAKKNGDWVPNPGNAADLLALGKEFGLDPLVEQCQAVLKG